MYLADAGQPDPRKQQIHLHRSISKYAIWQAMVEETPGPVYEYSSFIAFISKYFPNVKWPRKTRLGRCNTCVQLKDSIEKAKTKANRNQLKKLLAEHLEWERGQKLEYSKRAADAKQHPGELLSIALDSADSLFLPQMHPPPKSWFRKYDIL